MLLLIHGGGWQGLNPVALQTEEKVSVVFRQNGYATLAVDYRRGAQGVKDVEGFYRMARQRVGPAVPICALGVSAGGQIALMLAVRYSDLACVVDFAGPTDLSALKRDPGGSKGYQLVTAAFARDQLGEFSPALQAHSIKAKLLLIYAQNDPLVPIAQGREMARADPRADLVVLPPGSATFVHTGVGAPISATGVSASAKAQAQLAEGRLLESVARAGPS